MDHPFQKAPLGSAPVAIPEIPANEWPLVATDERGVPRIDGTSVPSLQIPLKRLAHEWMADEICHHHPGLTLPLAHAALGYDFENQTDCDRLMKKSLKRTDPIFARDPIPQGFANLRSAPVNSVGSFSIRMGIPSCWPMCVAEGKPFEGEVFAHPWQITIEIGRAHV